MSDTLGIISELIKAGEFQLSAHAVRELSADGIVILPLVERIDDAVVVEDYPEYHKGAVCSGSSERRIGRPVHLLWGIPKGQKGPAVLVTAYKPDPSQWSGDFRRRK